MKSKFIIFGCGYHGRAAYRKCINNKLNLICWVDNNKSLHDKSLFNLKIISIQKLKTIKFDKIILCGRNIKDQVKQISKLKLKDKIVLWNFFDLIPPVKIIKKRDKKLNTILKIVIHKLNRNRIPYWVDTSGLLTLVRKDYISLLSDFDLGFEQKYLAQIKKIFKSNKFYNVQKKYNIIKKKKYFQISVHSKNNTKFFEPAIIDFSFYKKIKNTFYKFDNRRKKFPSSYLYDFKKFKRNNINFNIPYKTNKYLINIYGKSFRKKVKFYTNPLKYKSLTVKNI